MHCRWIVSAAAALGLLLAATARAEPVTLGLAAYAAGSTLVGIGAGVAGYFGYCRLTECCTDEHIPRRLGDLRRDIEARLFGQPMVAELPLILAGQRGAGKALTLSFHGWPGNGKNYVVEMLARHLYARGLASKFVRLYVGGEFLNPNRVYEYQERLGREIEATVAACARSLIVFDEVHDLPPKVLDVVKSMIEYRASTVKGVDYSQAIFIFLSNSGGDEIMRHFDALGKPREKIVLADFENVIRNAAYANPGGFKESTLIDAHLIDHFIPFLPMEQKHVEQCIVAEFRAQGVPSPPQPMIDDVMSILTFGPPNNPVYANAGCKRIKKQVSYTIQRYSKLS